MPNQIGLQQMAIQPCTPPVLTKGEVKWSGRVKPSSHVQSRINQSLTRVKDSLCKGVRNLPSHVELGVDSPPLDPMLPAYQEKGPQDGHPQEYKTHP